MASKARDLSNFISVATIDATEIATNAITTDKVADTAITHAKLHTTMDLSGKTVSFAVNQISGNAIDGGVISNFTSTGVDDNATSTKLTVSDTGIDVTGEITADGLALGDGQIATFGNSDDLQIWHDGSNSRISDVGAGNLVIRASSGTYIQSINGENCIAALEDSSVNLFHNNAAKLATTSSGVVAVGTAGITSFTGTTKLGVVSQGSTAATDYSGYDFIGNNQSNPVARIAALTRANGSTLSFGTSNSYASGITNTAMTIGTTGNVGIGNSVSQAHSNEGTYTTKLRVGDDTASSNQISTIQIVGRDSSGNGPLGALEFINVRDNDVAAKIVARRDIGSSSHLSAGQLDFYTDDGSGNLNVNMSIDAYGNVGIGDESPSTALQVVGTVTANGLVVDSGTVNTVATFQSSGDANAYIIVKDSGSSGGAFIGAVGTHTILGTGGSTERMRIDSSGIVTMPYQPSFLAYATTDQAIVNDNAIMDFGGTTHNIGGHFSTSTGRFTAPVDGTYHLSAGAIVEGFTPSTYRIMMRFRINGAEVKAAIASGGTHNSAHDDGEASVSGTMYLNANDYVDIKLAVSGASGTGNIWGHASSLAWTNFTGHLVG